MTNKPLVSIIIPACNEAYAIRPVLLDVLRYASGDVEIIVVDDGSDDGTREMALETIAESGAKNACVVSHEHNRGLGASLLTGGLAAKGEYVLWFDGDGQHRGKDVPVLMDELRADPSLDYVIGVRGSGSYRALSRRPGKAVLKFLSELAAGGKLGDFNSGMRAIRRTLYLSWAFLYPDGFGTSTATSILLTRLGCKGKEMPILTRKRSGRPSSVNQLQDGVLTIRLIFRVWKYIRRVEGAKKEETLK